MRAPTAAEMRAIDAAAVARDGEITLMRRAGDAIAALIPHYAQPGPIVGIAGNGNNGGDVFAALAALDGARSRIVYCDQSVAGSAARVDARDRARTAGVVFRPLIVDSTTLAGAGLLLDGILGANARLPLDPTSAALVVAINGAGAPILAIDVPTGLDPTTGAVDETCVRAVATIALGAPKLGCFLEPGRSSTGQLWCDDLGMAADDAGAPEGSAHVLTEGEFSRLLPRREGETDKRRAGAPLILAGSEQFPGAAVLCARGAARSGAGYVTVATPSGAAAAIRSHLIEQVVVTFNDRDALGGAGEICDLLNHCGSIAIGPGLGLSETVGTIVRSVIARTELPIVADASALFHLGKHLSILHGKRVVITPHAGEFARLTGLGRLEPHDRLPRLRAFVAEHEVTTLLKGRSTLVADRITVHVNPTGTPALATAGTGDVLTGIIATLLAQGLAPIDAARVGAFWHGRAGSIAGAQRPVGVIAGDVAEALSEAARPQPAAADPQRIF
ncbi:MAG: NAD(P)H-hydrate dehydratase [Candidatus Velthaea sp.]|jgi:NAD(P)H-hydrate epimerase